MMQAEPTQREMNELRLLTCDRMAAADQAAISLGISGLELMENAGRAVADAAIERLPALGRVAVLCGPGNNGGDGFVAARYLARRGRSVRVGLLGARDRLRGDAAEMARLYDGEVAKLSPELLDGADLVIDALFGAGLNRPIECEGAVGRLFEEIAGRGLDVLAVDVPSGLNGDTGVAGGAMLAANRTVTFFRRKPGHLLMPGRRLCGRLTVADIGIPDAVLAAPLVPAGERLMWANGPALWRGQLVGTDAADQHKYHRGHTVVVSGGIEMSGAARLAARAAIRVGSGLVTVAAPADALAAHAAQFNAIMLAMTPDAEALRRMLKDTRKNAVVIGPGLGVGERTLGMVMTVLATPASAVLDADALSSAATSGEKVFEAIKAKAGGRVVLTPHEGEFARLFGDPGGGKVERARAAAERSGGVVVLKGADTVIAAPDGRAVINDNAPPWLATAGSGDVLSGILGGLLAQRMAAFEAACAAVWLHGAAGAVVGRGLIAEDIAEALPAVFQADWAH